MASFYVFTSESVTEGHPDKLCETLGTNTWPEDEVQTRAADCLDFRLGSIIRRFDLRRLTRRENGRLYRRLSVYGRVGRVDLDLPWENNDLVAALGSPSS